MGFGEPVRRSTRADANEARDGHIYAEFAGRLIVQARKLYAREEIGLKLTNTVYALDSTTIDLCLSVFPWAHFRTANAAVKMHTLLDLHTLSQADDQLAGLVDHPPRQADQPWVRGGEADSRNFANISIVYKGQIRGVCLSRGGCRRRLLHQEDLLRH
jgi:hypothetical protein